MPRILIVHATSDDGHDRVAAAVADGFRRRGCAVEIVAHDELAPTWWRDARHALDRLARAHAPSLWQAFDRRADRASVARSDAPRDQAARERAAAVIARVRPDAIITTSAIATARFGAVRPPGVPHVAVVTDLVPGRRWLQPGVDRYAVPSQAAATALYRLGAERARVVVTGLPIRAAFADASRARARAAIDAWLALDGRPLVVIAAGAAPTDRAQRVLDAVARATGPAHLVACHPGWQPLAAPGIAVHVVGVTARFPELVAAADVVVTRPGASTIAECCALGRPMIVVDAVPGAPADHAWWLEAAGAAIRVAGPVTAATALSALLTTPGLRRRIAADAARLGRPRASDAVVGLTLAELGGAPRSLASAA